MRPVQLRNHLICYTHQTATRCPATVPVGSGRQGQGRSPAPHSGHCGQQEAEGPSGRTGFTPATELPSNLQNNTTDGCVSIGPSTTCPYKALSEQIIWDMQNIMNGQVTRSWPATTTSVFHDSARCSLAVQARFMATTEAMWKVTWLCRITTNAFMAYHFPLLCASPGVSCHLRLARFIRCSV